MNGREPSPTHMVVKKNVNGHEVSAGFYPGFARSIAVDGEIVYEQKANGPFPFNLPEGQGPWKSSPLILSSDKGYRVVLHLDDPHQAIDHVEIVLRPPKPETDGGGVTAYQDEADTWTIDNTVIYCPPFCG
jgi:hypothetical protein